MKRTAFLAVLFAALTLPLSLRADDFTPDPGFISLFNGKDLTGWRYMPEPKNDIKADEKFDGKTEASDGRYSAKDGILTVHAHDPAKGPRIRHMWTVQEFPKDFHLKLEFRAEV